MANRNIAMWRRNLRANSGRIRNSGYDKTRPPMFTDVEEIDYQGQKIIVISITPDGNTYATTDGRFLKRLGKNSKPYYPDEMSHIYSTSQTPDFSSQIIAESSADDINRIVFVEQFFIDEIPQKFKFAYLQYYYLCDFVKEINEANNIKINIDNSLKNRTFRNCLAHYGLGQFLSEEDIMVDDVLMGLTIKAFGMDYMTTKEMLYKFLGNLAKQIKDIIF